jgi:hypothetical protein
MDWNMRRKSVRPGLECLESRTALSCGGHVFVVTRPLAQEGRGSLPWAAEKATHAGDRIVFSKGTQVAELLVPVTLHRGVTLSGPRTGLLLATDAPIKMVGVRVINVTIDPIENNGLVLD